MIKGMPQSRHQLPQLFRGPAQEHLSACRLRSSINAAGRQYRTPERLLCAQDNAQTPMDNLMTSLQPLQPILDMVGVLVGIVGLPALELPNMASISASTEQVADHFIH